MEARFVYPVDVDKSSHGDRQSFSAELYMFVPKVVEISRYSKETFYNDLKPFLRLRQPHLKNRPQISLIQTFIEKFADERNSKYSTPYIVDEIRLFACSFASLLSKKKLAADPPYQILKEFRHLVQFSEKFSVVDEELLKIYRELTIVDEYCAYKYRDQLAAQRLLGEITPEILEQFGHIMAREKRYAINQGFYWMDFASTNSEQEKFVSRRSVLKKHVQKVLYLNLRPKPIFAVQQQLSSIVAAGTAALWAVLAEIIIRTHFLPSLQNGASMRLYFLSMSGFLFITALMFAYVLKDRIKEMGKHYFQSHFFLRIPDNSNDIKYPSLNQGDKLIGSIQESTRFVTLDNLPEPIKERRLRQSIMSEDECDSSCIHYRKTLDISQSALKKLQHEVPAIQDILRFSIGSFLKKLGDPTNAEYLIDDRGNVELAELPRVYNIDIIFLVKNLNSNEESFRCTRLVLNKDGLLRCEDFKEN